MRILFTGASSFTGFHFVSALALAGHEVICPLRGTISGYTGIRRIRVDRLQPVSRLLEGISFGSEPFIKLLRDSGPALRSAPDKAFDLLCHHAADVANYKSPDFDPIHALENNTKSLPAVLSAFKQAGGKGVVLTGTLFEPDEGKGDQSLRAFSPYGLSKGLTWEVFRYYCHAARISLGKFVLPNPFGPWEEPRFTAYLMNTWKAGKTSEVKTPDYVRDNCHVSLLAQAYVAFANRVTALQSGSITASPSGYVESQGAFTARVAREVSSRTRWPCQFELLKQEDFSEPLVRSNKEPAAPAFPQWNEIAAWDDFVGFYQREA